MGGCGSTLCLYARAWKKLEKYGKMSGVRDFDLLAFESSRRPVSVTTCFLISWVASGARKVKHICSITNSTSASSWIFKTNYAFPPYLQPQPQPTLCSSKRGKQCFLMHLNAFKWYSRWSKQITSFTEVQHQPTSWLRQQLTVLRVVPEGLMCREQLTPNRPNPWLSKAPLNFGAEGCSNLSSSMFEIETSAPQFVLKFSYWAPSRPGTWQEKESTRRQCPFEPFEPSWTDWHLFNTIAKQHSLVVLGHDCDAAAIHRSWAWILLLHTSLDPQWPESEGCLESASPIHWPRKLERLPWFHTTSMCFRGWPISDEHLGQLIWGQLLQGCCDLLRGLALHCGLGFLEVLTWGELGGSFQVPISRQWPCWG